MQNALEWSSAKATLWALRTPSVVPPVVNGAHVSPSRSSVGGESRRDPPRGQHHKVPPRRGGIVPHSIRQLHRLCVCAHVANALPAVRRGAGGRIGEQLQPTLGEYL